MTKKLIGGQAVIEGVLMKSDSSWCVSVRKSDNSIVSVKERYSPVSEEYPFLKIPFLRGVVNLFEMLYIGIKALTISSDIQMADQEKKDALEKINPSAEPDTIDDTLPPSPEYKSSFSVKDLILSFTLSMTVALLFFMILPHYITQKLIKLSPATFKFHLFEGFLRFSFFLFYVLFISCFKDIKRVFQYHGAEHKSVFCYESGQDLTIENTKKFLPYHPRCGTNFIFIVMVISIIIFSFIKTGNFATQIGLKILLIPLIAGISYEMLRLGARFKIFSFFNLPGIYFQRLTALEPDDQMIEVALNSLVAVREMEELDVPKDN